MLKIEKIHINHLRNDTHFQFHTEFRSLVEKHGAAALKIKPQFDAYLPLYEREDIALKKIVKSALTAQIHEADKARDEIYTGMVGTNTNALKHFNPEVRAAATRLKIVFDTYGDIANKSLIDETSAVYNILQDLQGKYAADTATVGISSWASELKTLNESFEQLMRDRFDEATARTDIVLKQARSEADTSYYEICERINALALIEGVSAYEPFIRSWNTVVAKFRMVRQGHRHAGGGQPEGGVNGG